MDQLRCTCVLKIVWRMLVPSRMPHPEKITHKPPVPPHPLSSHLPNPSQSKVRQLPGAYYYLPLSKQAVFEVTNKSVHLKCFSWISASDNIVYKRIESFVSKQLIYKTLQQVFLSHDYQSHLFISNDRLTVSASLYRFAFKASAIYDWLQRQHLPARCGRDSGSSSQPSPDHWRPANWDGIHIRCLWALC